MIVLNLQEALNILGEDKFSNDIKYMAEFTYNLWFNKYYSHFLDKFPTWIDLYNLFMSIAKNLKLDNNTYYNCYVAINNNNIVGFIGLNYNDFDIFIDDNKNNTTLWLSDLFVWPEYRGQNISSMLINHVKNIANNKNTELYLACEDYLIKYYNKFGFNKINKNINKDIYNNKYLEWNFMTN